jgi:hypothetical protein
VPAVEKRGFIRKISTALSDLISDLGLAIDIRFRKKWGYYLRLSAIIASPYPGPGQFFIRPSNRLILPCLSMIGL